ncbi:C40 family peptidase [Luteimonas soli]|uniref:C40 family peptidase n=1 Tax=Luteimonas soli TaxID=1648966 RepID=A0ABV7XQY6_9GAMM
MTTKEPAQGRQAAPRRRIPALSLALPLLALAFASPAFAATGLAADSADQLHTSTPLSETVAGPMLPEQRSMLFANDVSMLIDAGANPAMIPVDADGRVRTLLKRALALLGTPYRWGGSTTDGFDCSGLVGYVFSSALGIELPRVSRQMAHSGEKVDRDALSAGDLVFFSRRGKRVDHVGIYLGNGRFVHAPRTGKDVMVSSLVDGYWSRKFMQARRVTGS